MIVGELIDASFDKGTQNVNVNYNSIHTKSENTAT